MPYCTKCGNTLEPNAKFCSACGTAVPVVAEPVAQPAPVAEPAPAYTAPVTEPTPAPAYTAPVTESAPAYVPTYTVPAEPAQPVVSGGTKALGFVGMGLGIFGLLFAVFAILFTLIGVSDEDYFSIGMSIGYAIFALPCAIVGRVLAGKSQDAGNTSGACSAGRGTGIAGIIVSAIALFIGFICLMTI